MNRFLVPSKDQIESQAKCDCGPVNLYTQEALKRRADHDFADRIPLDSIAEKKRIELLDFYNKQMTKVKFSRENVMKQKSNTERGQKIGGAQDLVTRDPNQEKISQYFKKKVLQAEVPKMKKSDSGYLRKRFELFQARGIEKVQRSNGHGSSTQIEVETLNILKENRKRFTSAQEKRNEFQAANYLSRLISNQHAAILQEQDVEREQRAIVRCKNKGYTPNLGKQRHIILRQNDLKKKRFKMIDESRSQGTETKQLIETFIPFVNERDAVGRMFPHTLLNNQLRQAIASKSSARKQHQSQSNLTNQVQQS